MRLALAAALLLLAPALAGADSILPSDRVKSHVKVRQAPAAGARAVGSLRPGEAATKTGSDLGWWRVQLADGTTGFVSKQWTMLVVDPAQPPPKRGFSVFRYLEEKLGGEPKAPSIDFVIRDPDPLQREFRNLHPELPVSGFARLLGGGLSYDLMIVLDLSTSTNEFADADVNGDGRAEDEWMGSDSIFRAQLEAAERLVGEIARLPGNRGGRRIRVGLVTYSGDEALRLDEEDGEQPVSHEEVYRLAGRDATLRLSLTRDYGMAKKILARLAREKPVGMTNVAAGVGRALIEFATAGDDGLADGRQKVILLVTDGKPSLPYDRERADRAASWAGKMAREAGVRVNAFALGRDAVTRTENDSVKRMARRTRGAYVPLEKPGDIVAVLDTTPFSVVERVKLVNRTTGEETGYIATGIDGSFYGEIPLSDGANRIEVSAVLSDDREVAETFAIDYVRARPKEELVDQLVQLRAENEALIERIKDRLAAEMRRKRQKRSLDMSVEEETIPANQP